VREYDILVCLGRFQPFHRGHEAIISKALELADTVVAIVGSAHRARSLRNPFTAEERVNLIHNSFPNQSRLVIAQVPDQMYNENTWIRSVQHVVQPYEARSQQRQPRVGIIGHDKDATSYYLRLFPKWEFVAMPMISDYHSTDIRNDFFINGNVQTHKLTEYGTQFLNEFAQTALYQQLQNEFRVVQQYRDSWKSAPYAPTFVTTDAVVIQGGHILLVQRGASPGRGLWALPGGFVDQNETLEEGVLRELREETRLKVPEPVLKGSIRRREVFDHPNRSDRGRTITHAYLIQLDGSDRLPRVKGSDDAVNARWFSLAELNPRELFEDHADIIRIMLGSEL
jgi:bifunctional NMN adenylyltransferase/nudix hydrolase